MPTNFCFSHSSERPNRFFKACLCLCFLTHFKCHFGTCGNFAELKGGAGPKWMRLTALNHDKCMPRADAFLKNQGQTSHKRENHPLSWTILHKWLNFQMIVLTSMKHANHGMFWILKWWLWLWWHLHCKLWNVLSKEWLWHFKKTSLLSKPTWPANCHLKVIFWPLASPGQSPWQETVSNRLAKTMQKNEVIELACCCFLFCWSQANDLWFLWTSQARIAFATATQIIVAAFSVVKTQQICIRGCSTPFFALGFGLKFSIRMGLPPKNYAAFRLECQYFSGTTWCRSVLHPSFGTSFRKNPLRILLASSHFAALFGFCQCYGK